MLEVETLILISCHPYLFSCHPCESEDPVLEKQGGA